jgi:hypothetical protein
MKRPEASGRDMLAGGIGALREAMTARIGDQRDPSDLPGALTGLSELMRSLTLFVDDVGVRGGPEEDELASVQALAVKHAAREILGVKSRATDLVIRGKKLKCPLPDRNISRITPSAKRARAIDHETTAFVTTHKEAILVAFGRA